MLGAAFPPSPLYLIAYVAFIPFFFLWQRVASLGQFIRFLYVQLFAFHLVCVYWTGAWASGKDNWLIISNVALLTLHPFFFIPFLLPAYVVGKRLGHSWGLAAFSLLWVSAEYWNAFGELSFPWMTIGNSQAFDIARIQLVEYTSVYGLSLIILTCNVVLFLLLTRAKDEWKPSSAKGKIAIAALLMMFFGPLVYGRILLSSRATTSAGGVKLALVQPNFDPWEKWGEGSAAKAASYETQFQTYLTTSSELAREQPDLIVWPETAVPFFVLLPRNKAELARVRTFVDSAHVPVFTGVVHAEYFDASKASATAYRFEGTNVAVEHYNSATLFTPGQSRYQVYKKVVLVPFGERLPYADTFKFLIEPLKWNVGISSWGKGADTLVYSFKPRAGDSVKFAGMICYESVYPNYVREFVRRGAQFLIVITNDSWWGKTSGAYQHAAFASFRAIETRRWIVQCANGGVSMFTDPDGVQRQSLEMFTKGNLTGTVEPRSGETFYVRHGDLFAQACVAGSVAILFIATIRRKKTV